MYVSTQNDAIGTTNSNLTTTRNIVDALFYPTKLVSNINLNNYTGTAIYRLNGSITNGAGPSYGILIVLGANNGDHVRQIQFADANNYIYTRVKYNGSWSAWQTLSFTT